MIRQIIVLLLISHLAQAQDINNYEFESKKSVSEKVSDSYHLTLATTFAIPGKEFQTAVAGENRNSIGFGFNMGIVANPFGKVKMAPVLIGGEFSYHSFGSDKIEPLANDITYKTGINYWSIQLVARKPLSNRYGVVPFIDGLAGTGILNSRTKVDKDLLTTVLDENETEIVNSTTHGAITYGIGVGFFTRKPPVEAGLIRNSLMLRIVYLYGSNSEFVVRNSVVVDQNQQVSYRTSSTGTSHITITIGLTIY